jgi:hypothetical protein
MKWNSPTWINFIGKKRKSPNVICLNYYHEGGSSIYCLISRIGLNRSTGIRMDGMEKVFIKKM